jgi:hypothetical protein
MNWGGPSFVLAIIALVIVGKFLNNWLRMPRKSGAMAARLCASSRRWNMIGRSN